MVPVETELRRVNDLLNAIYSEITGRLPLMAEEQSQAATRELSTALRELRTYYTNHPGMHPDRHKALEDLSGRVRNEALRSTIGSILHPPTPAWVRNLDSIQAQILNIANLAPDEPSVLQLGAAVEETKNRFWFRAIAPTTDELLLDLKQRITDPRLIAAIEQLLPSPAVIPSHMERPVPARSARRHPEPTIAELRREGFSNLIDTNLGGTIYRFAARDSSLDMVGMSAQQLIDYAAANPGQMRIFVVDRRGFATRELRTESRRDMARIRADIEAGPK